MTTRRLTVRQINHLNIGLMLLSAGCALWRPFETFLFVYAFLGPLHYLTEISWLHDRQYFTKRKYDYLILLAAGIGVTAGYFRLIPGLPSGLGPLLTAFAFGAALIFAVVKGILPRIASLFLIAALAVVLKENKTYTDVFGLFLPTLIHVFIFTALFILVGALRGRDASGLLSLAVFIGCTSIFFFWHPTREGYHATEYVRSAYGTIDYSGNFTGGFISLNHTFMTVFHLHDFTPAGGGFRRFIDSFNDFLYRDPLALAVMSFIAFSYMYHYLNWFSKTSIIQWHAISRWRFAAIIAIWLASIGIYLYDYHAGLQWLFFLSFTHVLLEFPLNHLTFIAIGREIRQIAISRRFAKPAPSVAEA